MLAGEQTHVMGSLCGFVAPASKMAGGKDTVETGWSPRTRRGLLLRKRLAFIQSMGRSDARFVRFVHKLVRLIRTIEKVIMRNSVDISTCNLWTFWGHSVQLYICTLKKKNKNINVIV